MGALIQDFKYGFRMLAKSPGFTAIAVLTLALGIGANTVVFGIVNMLFIKGLSVKNEGRIVALNFHQKASKAMPLFSYPDFKDVTEQGASFAKPFAYFIGLDGLSTGDHADRALTSYVTGNYFTSLGLKPALGRLILPSEGSPSGSNAVLVLGYDYWQSRFGGRPNVVGKQVRVNGHPFTIVGVAPKGFQGMLKSMDMDAYMPLNMVKVEFPGFLENRTGRGLLAFARLKRGTSLPQAQAAFDVIAHRLSQEHPKNDVGASIVEAPLQDASYNPLPEPGEYQKEQMAAALFMLLAAFVLLLASFNVANLLLVRATAREHEMTIRRAMGAPRSRLVRMMLSESLLLALLGCSTGVLLGAWGTNAISAIHFNVGVPLVLRIGLDWRVIAYAIFASVLASALAGMLPAIRAARTDPNEALHDGGRTTTTRHHRLRNGLVTAQIAGAVMLLAVAGLFTHSLQRAGAMDFGFSPNHVADFQMDPQEIGYTAVQGQEFYKNLLTAVRALPGVQTASLAFDAPLGQYHNMNSVYVEGRPIPAGQAAPVIPVDSVTPGYFKTNGIPIVEGRSFADSDTAKSLLVAIINQTMAKDLWPGQDPIGRRFSLDSSGAAPIEVVGIARDSKYQSLTEAPTLYFYLPLSQHYIWYDTLQVRSLIPPATLDPEVEHTIHGLAPGLPIYGVHTMREVLDGAGGLYAFRLGAYLAMSLGVLGLVLAVVGVYGVISYSTSQRTHEFGIRMALGAQPGDIWRIVFRQGLIILGFGVLIGGLSALGLSRIVAGLLFGVSAYDPLTYAGVIGLISAVTLLACYIPARRATKVDPMVALRYE